MFNHYSMESVIGTGPDIVSHFETWTYLATEFQISFTERTDFRCDHATYANGRACIFTNVRAYWSLDRSDPAVDETANHIYTAFNNITFTRPGLIGTYVPETTPTRITQSSARTTTRRCGRPTTARP